MQSSSRDRLHEITAGTHAAIDLDAYETNLNVLRTIAGRDRSLMAIVKANAYGHGAIQCAESAARAGAAFLGVARIDEALQLRRAGIERPVLIVGPPNTAQIDLALASNVQLTVSTEAAFDHVAAAAQRMNAPASVHLKVDTGLHRYGALPDLAVSLARRMAESEWIDFRGIYTHFSSSDERDPEPTNDQIAIMQRVLDQLEKQDLTPEYVHVANSAGIIERFFNQTNLVRAGIASYGLDPSDDVPVDTRFKPVMSVHSVLARRFVLAQGEPVSYNRTYRAERDEPTATVPIGYADGIERHLSNTGWFSHKGRRCPIRGRVCMDQTVIGVPEDAEEGDLVTIFGDGSNDEMTINELARMCSTNTYEIPVRVAARVPRIFLRSGEPVAWSVPLLGEHGSFS